MIESIIFFSFALILFASALVVITTSHPVRGVVSLICAFVSCAVLWMLLEAEFLALALVFVYIGAVMTLFLFVVMMLNITRFESVSLFEKWGVFLGSWGIIGAGLFTVWFLRFTEQQREAMSLFFSKESVVPRLPKEYSNVMEIGKILYTDYILPFELVSVLLVVAIIIAISLTFRGRRPGAKSQKISEQIAVDPKQRIRMVNFKDGK